jgi:hypothetical protein
MSKGQNKLVIALVVVLLAVIAGGAVVIVRLLNRAPEAAPVQTAGMQIGYEADVGVAMTQEDLDEQMNEILNSDTMISLEYTNDAQSSNGKDFDCYIANSANNRYDMYIGLYADLALTDELFLSQLLRPGTAFNHVTLNRALEPGNHTVYCVMTQVKEENGEFVIHNSMTVTMNFLVS